MPRYRFTWDRFDDQSVARFAGLLGYDPQRHDGTARAWLGSEVKGLRPAHLKDDEIFDMVRYEWLPKQSRLGNVVEQLIERNLGPGGRPRSESGYVKYLRDCRRSSQFRGILLKELRSAGDSGPTKREVSPMDGGLQSRWVLAIAKQQDDGRQAHDYQKEAWNRLSAELARHDAGAKVKGLLVMPTGSGKTYTTVRWLTEHILNRRGKVLWIAHRTELLAQAAKDFQRLASLARSREQLRGRLVGGGYESLAGIGSDDDIIIASIGILARNPEHRAEILSYDNLHVVIDEAHHAPAKSYRDLIAEYEEAGGRFLLGLTATPTRTIEKERPELSRLFGGKVIHQVDLRELIERGILARPVPARVKTGADVEVGLTESDRRHLAQFGELSEAWLARIAEMEGRNRIIVQHYLANREKYGKTIVFAANVKHAAILAREFREKGVEAEYVASHRPDGSDQDTAEIFENFRNGEYQILVNVQMVTEGVDVPDVQTVFLARPTSSEILVRQMIGRALRGLEVGGTEQAYLVSFDDHWERYRDWQSPLDLVPDITAWADSQGIGVDGRTEEPDRRPRLNIEDLPHDVVHAVITQLRQLRPDQKVEVFEAVPLGQYILERQEDEESIRQVVSIFEHQKPFWDELMAELQATPKARLVDAVGAERWDAIFADCDPPVPPQDEIDAMVRHFAAGADKPEYHAMEDREKYDPRRLAAEIKAHDLGPTAQRQLVESRHGGFARAVYPTAKDFHDAVQIALSNLMYEGDERPPATVNFEPRPDQALKDDKPHDLVKLLERTLETGAKLLNVPSLPQPQPPTWSRRPVKSWWGIATWQTDTNAGHGRIRINCLMNSSDVSEDALCFLLWHEYLHVYLKQGHTSDFKELQKRWEGWIECDRQIERLVERFEIRYW